MRFLLVAFILALTMIFGCVLGTKVRRAQAQGATAQTEGQGSGDQVVDGISETDLIARYLLDGNAQDRSRNSLHGELRSSTASYVTDEQFGRVLSLMGEKGESV